MDLELEQTMSEQLAQEMRRNAQHWRDLADQPGLSESTACAFRTCAEQLERMAVDTAELEPPRGPMTVDVSITLRCRCCRRRETYHGRNFSAALDSAEGDGWKYVDDNTMFRNMPVVLKCTPCAERVSREQQLKWERVAEEEGRDDSPWGDAWETTP
jgi:hypothetical protein